MMNIISSSNLEEELFTYYCSTAAAPLSYLHSTLTKYPLLMFAPFRKGKPSKGKESYFVDIGDETILSEPDCQLEVDSAKNDDFLVLSRYVEIYAPATVTDQEFSSGAKPAEEITSSTVVYKTDRLHTGSQDQQDLAEISFLVPEVNLT